MVEEEAADQYVVDQLRAAGVHSGESLLLVDERGDVPQAGRVALVGAFEAGGLDLGTRRALEDLGRGGGDLVVQVADDGTARPTSPRRGPKGASGHWTSR
jgi:hypothetical protein